MTRLRAEMAAALCASGSNHKAWLEAVCDAAEKRTHLEIEIGLTEQQRDAAIARAESAEAELCDVVRDCGGNAANVDNKRQWVALHFQSHKARAEAAEKDADICRASRAEIMAHAERLRAALFDIRQHVAPSGIDRDDAAVDAICIAAIAANPAQSLAKLKAQVLDAVALVTLADYPEAAAKVRAEAERMASEAE
ncbi:MAG: hypothetical protein EBR82_22585 [Caulobacteraceae bacterium]|nr:hypothetical protein [Caulobacteraceae bacterium]